MLAISRHEKDTPFALPTLWDCALFFPIVVVSPECPAESREPMAESRFQFSIAKPTNRKPKSAIGFRLTAFGKTTTLGT